MSIRESDNPDLFRKVQERNLLRQYDLLTSYIEIGLTKGIEAFDKYTLWALNHVAVAGISRLGGRYRTQPVFLGNHMPPRFECVPDLMDQFFAFIYENWTIIDDYFDMAAYALWRLNWIHPFVEGNGRTARAACYYLLCMKMGGFLPGKTLIPELIRQNREPYYDALRVADAAWNEGRYGYNQLTQYLLGLFGEQLSSVFKPSGPPT